MALSATLASAKSVYDPFIQEFQVGGHNDPDEMELIWGFPSGLLKEASLDTVWTNAARLILEQEPSSNSPHLTLKLLAAMNDTTATESWLKWHRLRILNLEAWTDSLDTTGRYLLAERLTMGFFRSVRNGNLKAARQLAQRLAVKDSKITVPARDRFVWDLRARLIGKILKLDSARDNLFFTSMIPLGFYDTGNAWAIWTAHRRLNGYPAFPHYLKTHQHAIEFSGLRKSWLNRRDIEDAAFSHDVKAGLGAKLLKKNDLNQHLANYPNPPGSFSLQGWWVSGQRRSRRGDTPFYESLGQRDDLHAGWRMDVLRRASEVHLLNGRWEPGLVDLELSLELAAEKSGTAGQRRRLRQWTEQALVLALAKDKPQTARRIYDLGIENLLEAEIDAFLKETNHWRSEIDLVIEDASTPEGMKTVAGKQVSSGEAFAITPVDSLGRAEFLRASAVPLWTLWAKWGLASISPNANNAAISSYRSLLEKCHQASDPALQADFAVQAVAVMMNNRLNKEAILRWALDKDIHNRSLGIALTNTSPMSGLAKKQLKDPAALHALLAVAMLTDDLRGIVGVATPMKQTGLTKQEKLCFLYPLPRTGAIHQALAKADNDPALILAVARNESLFEPSVRSVAGALGWLQIMPFHFPDKGARPGADNWSCAGISIAKGDALLKENRRRYKGNPYKTLAAYNAGPGAAGRWQKQLGETTRQDIYLAWIGYPETRLYVEKVLIDRMVYDWIIRESRLTH